MIGAGTAANRLAGVPLSTLAATPREVSDGRVWLLVTSGLLADDPWLPSLIGFAIVLCVALCLLSVRTVMLVAAAGQLLSALAVYSCIDLVRLLDSNAFASVVDLNDYGVSAMIAAWIGAVAGLLWRRGPTRRGHLAVAAGCLLCLAIGIACRPNVTFLDAEHLIAFAAGVTVAGPHLRERVTRSTQRVISIVATITGTLT